MQRDSLSVFSVTHIYQTSAFSASCSASFVGPTAAPSHVTFSAGQQSSYYGPECMEPCSGPLEPGPGEEPRTVNKGGPLAPRPYSPLLKCTFPCCTRHIAWCLVSGSFPLLMDTFQKVCGAKINRQFLG